MAILSPPRPAVPPSASDRPTSRWSAVAHWWEDPHFRLNLTAGQRYTAVLVVILTVLLLKFGLPIGPTSLRASADSGRSASAAAPAAAAPANQGSQASTTPPAFGPSTSAFSVPPSVSAGTLGPLPDESTSAPAVSGSPPPPSGSVPAGSGQPAPSPSTCPVALPSTGTPIDSLVAQLTALCAELLAPLSGTVPIGSLPGGASSLAMGGATPSAPGASGSTVREGWVFADSPIGASGVPDPKWPAPLAVEMSGKSPTVTVGLVQSGAVSGALVNTLGQLAQNGAVVQVLLVPQPGTAGGAARFGSWVQLIVAALKPVQLVEIGTGSAPTSSNASTVAAYTAAGLTGAHAASPKVATGVLWLDGGASSSDGAVWSSLASAGAWSSSSFMARALGAAAACTSQSGFTTLERQSPVAAALPLVSEAVPGAAPAGGSSAESSCMKSSIAQHPGPSLALWRQWEAPAS